MSRPEPYKYSPDRTRLSPVRWSELVRLRPCRHRKCEARAIINGWCREHFIKALDRWERESRKTKIVARVQPNDKLTDGGNKTL